MSLQANKSDIKSYHSCKNFTQFQTGWVYFQMCVVNFGYYCDLLSGFLSSLLIETFLLHLHENLWYCAMSGKSPSMLYYFWIFPIALPHLNVSWCYKMVPNFFFFWGGGGEGGGGTCKEFIIDESQYFYLLCWLDDCHPPTFGPYCTL